MDNKTNHNSKLEDYEYNLDLAYIQTIMTQALDGEPDKCMEVGPFLQKVKKMIGDDTRKKLDLKYGAGWTEECIKNYTREALNKKCESNL